MGAFALPLDIANRACQIIGVPRISNFTATKAGLEINACYDNLREAELQRNLWGFTTRRVITRPLGPSSLLWTPPTWLIGTTYAVGSVVVDTNTPSNWWQSKVASNIGNAPAVGAYWRRYFGPDSLTSFVAQASVFAAPAQGALTAVSSGSLGAATYYVQSTYTTSSGETLPSGEASIVVPTNSVPYVASPPAATGASSWNVYMSTVSGQEVLQSATIAIGTAFQLPTSGLIMGQGPPVSTTAVGFYAGELTSFNGTVYLSLISNNTTTPPNGAAWLEVDGTTVFLQILYPIGAGPSTQVTTRNIFRKPHGFLRQAPSNPKGGATVWLGMPQGNVREDWVFEGDYIVSDSFAPLMMRYVADFVDVPDMHALFCEGLAARIAEAVCEPVTQSTDKLSHAAATYSRAMHDARTVNAIEIGPVDQDLDDLIVCRL